jgi:hypothetical protein
VLWWLPAFVLHALLEHKAHTTASLHLAIFYLDAVLPLLLAVAEHAYAVSRGHVENMPTGVVVYASHNELTSIAN